MRGFASRATVEDALAWIDLNIRTTPSETVPIEDAHERVLTEPVVSKLAVPAFDRSAMDGYALRADETHGASDYNRLDFRIVGESMPGRPCVEQVQRGECVRIMTGAPVPSGCDAVVPAEYVTEDEDVARVTMSVPSKKHIGQRGEDVDVGQTVLPSNRHLRPQDIGLLASIGEATVSVRTKPNVRVLVTGDELVPAGAGRGPFEIFDSNSVMLAGLISRDGGAVEIRRLPDDRHAIQGALIDRGADVILVSGGSSVGAEDHAPSLVSQLGELAIHGIAMRPSSPTGMGRVGDALVVLLPGNPVSCLCAYDFFAGRAIRLMGGRNAEWPYRRRTATLGRKVVSAIGRLDYCRVVETKSGEVEPIATSGASILSSTTRADGFAVVRAESEGYVAGSEVEYFCYD